MSETLGHRHLVSVIVNWVLKKHSSTPGFCSYCDNPTVLQTEKPPPIDGFYADVHAVTTPQAVTLRGEAKTLPDLDSERSFNQIVAFLRFLSVRPEPTLIMATPWQARASAKNIVRLARRQAVAPDVPVLYLTDLDKPC